MNPLVGWYTPKDYNVQETEEDRAASQSARPGLKKEEAQIRQNTTSLRLYPQVFRLPQATKRVPVDS